ncbi:MULTISPECIES: chaplin [unclassified Streptomyces]|uniref:chaplin n=1 Tax=unclassified Streptomyces TaxID=2593676 RepID=UPI000FFE71B9|nr:MULTISPECIES: chaplin [unclassified Streptomyces]
MRQVTRKGLMTVAAATGVLAAAGGYAHADSGASGSSSNSPGVLSGNTVQVPVHVPVNVCGNTVDVVGVLNPAAGNSCANESGGGSSHGHGGSRAHGHASDSPGVGSGNLVQVPVDVPVNVCGNSVDVVGVLNPAAGNSCANESGGGSSHGHGGSRAHGHASDSPGVGSGNQVQVPVDVPVNVCGNSIDVIGIGNPAKDDDCTNGGSGGGHKTPPGGHETTPPGNPSEPTHPGTPSTPPGTGGETPGGSTHPNHPGTQTGTQPAGSAQLAHTGSDLPMGLVLPVGAGALLAGAVMYRKARASA